MKYYFISYWHSHVDKGWIITNQVIQHHPLEWQRTANQTNLETKSGWIVKVISWQEVSEEEYNKYN